MTVNYTNLIATAKIAARDFLRTQKILPHLNKITSLKNEITETSKHSTEMIAAAEKRVAVKEFESAALPDAHPLKTERVEAATKAREEFEKFKKETTEDREKFIKNVEEKITEHELAVTEWTEGKRLVSKEDLDTIAKEYLAKLFKNSFVEGDYNTTA